MATSVKISQLGNIGTNISGNSLIPIVDVTGVSTTDKVNVGNLGNFILGQAGNTLNAAFLSNLAYSVANAAQPNITSVGNLNNLTVVGATDLGAVGNVTIIGGLVGQVLSTDGAGNLSWVNQSGGGGGNIGNITFNGANISTDLEDTDIQIIANGTGNVNISSSAGNVWIFDADGVLTLPNADETGFGNIYFEENSSTITFGLDDNGSSRTYSFAFNGLTLPNGPALNTNTGDLEINVDGNVWTFDATGYLRIPNDGSFGALNSSILAFSSQNNLPIYIEVIDTGNSNIARQWVFDNSGNLTLPANTFQINYANGDPVLLGGGSSIANANSTVTIPDADGNVEIIAGYTSIAIGSSFGGSSPSGYLAGTFTNQPTSGGNGTGLTVDYTCVTTNGSLTSIILNNPGSGYLNGDVVIIDGGNGPGLSATITLAVTTPGTWTFDTDGQVTLPDGTVMGDVEGSNTFGFYNPNPSTQFLLEAGTTAWIFDGANDNLTLPGDVNLPLVAKLNSGGVGVTNAAEFGTEVTVDGSNIINGSQIYMGAGTAESRAIVNSDGNSLMYLGVENPGFAGMVGIDPGVTSEYAIQVGANNEIQIGAVVGPITTTEYVAGLGVLNANGNINGIFANGNVTVIGAGDLGWSFDSTGNLSLPQGGSIFSEGFTPSGSPGNTISLQPSGSGTITNQKLLVYPTGGDGDHIHLATGNLYQTELFLGSDNLYVKLANTGNIVVNSNDGAGNSATWTFDTTGNLTMPGNIIVDVVGEADISSDANININAAGNIWTFGTDGSLQVPANFANPIPGTISAANGYPALLAYGSGGGLGIHGGPELDWMNADDPANNFGNNTVIRNTLYLNATGLYIGMNENGVVGNADPSWLFEPDGNTTFPAIGTADLGNLAVANNFSTNGSGGDITLTGGNITGANVIAANTFLGTGNLHLQPDPANVGSYLNVYLTVGPDVHIVSNDGNLILGSDTSANIMIDVDGNVSIQANTSTPHTWTFGSDGNLTVPSWIDGANTYFTGAIAGNVLTVTNAVDGTIARGQRLYGPTVAAETIITLQLTQSSGNAGGNGTYSLTGTQTVTTEQMFVNSLYLDGDLKLAADHGVYVRDAHDPYQYDNLIGISEVDATIFIGSLNTNGVTIDNGKEYKVDSNLNPGTYLAVAKVDTADQVILSSGNAANTIIRVGGDTATTGYAMKFNNGGEGLIPVGLRIGDNTNSGIFGAPLEVSSILGAAANNQSSPAGASLTTYRGTGTIIPNDEWGSYLYGSRFRGTLNAPLPTKDGDWLMEFGATSFDGTNNNGGGEIAFRVDGTVTGSSNPSKIEFYNTVTGANSQSLGMVLDASQNLTVTGNITADNIITGTGTTGNITGANVIAANTFQSTVVAFSALPAATTPGLRAFINNGNLAAVGNFGAQVAGGGANYVPVFSDGANWCIG